MRRPKLRLPGRFDPELFGVEPRVVGLVVVVGVACGAIGGLYLLALHLLQHVLWPTEWSGAVGFAILGGVGLAVGLLVKFVGPSGDVELMVDNIHVSGTATGVRMLRSLIPTSLLCVASGGAMGPEAPLVQTTGSLASWTATRAGLRVRESRVLTVTGMAAGFTVLFGAPLGAAVFALELLHRRGLQYYEALLPAVIGSLAGYGVYVAASTAGLEPVWHLPSPGALQLADLGWAVVAGIGGALIAIGFTYSTAALRWGARRVPAVLRPATGGLVLAAFGPRVGVLTDVRRGADQRDPRQARRDGRVLRPRRAREVRGHLGDALVRVARRLHHPALLHGRVSRPRALHGIVPDVNEAVMIAAFMAAANTGVTKTPLGSTLVVTEMAGFQLLPTTLIAVVVAFTLTGEVGLIHSQHERDPVGQDEHERDEEGSGETGLEN